MKSIKKNKIARKINNFHNHKSSLIFYLALKQEETFKLVTIDQTNLFGFIFLNDI